MMFAIDPNALYTKADIARELGDGMTVEQFLLRLAPRMRRQFKSVFWGRDLIDALNAPAPGERERAGALAVSGGRRGGGRNPRNPHEIDPASVL